MILTLESLWRHWLKSSRIFLFSYRKATEARCVTGSFCMEALRHLGCIEDLKMLGMPES